MSVLQKYSPLPFLSPTTHTFFFFSAFLCSPQLVVTPGIYLLSLCGMTSVTSISVQFFSTTSSYLALSSFLMQLFIHLYLKLLPINDFQKQRDGTSRKDLQVYHRQTFEFPSLIVFVNQLSQLMNFFLFNGTSPCPRPILFRLCMV